MHTLTDRGVLHVEDLSVRFTSSERTVDAVRNLSFHVDRGETLAIVGESGSGKSVTSLALMRLIEQGGGQIIRGAMTLRRRDGALVDLTHADPSLMRSVRGADMAMIFQEPMTSLNPVLKIADQLCEPLILHMNMSRNRAIERGIELLENVGIPSAGERIQAYPHQLSGGMRQRVMIAMALACQPSLLIADEPTTALDVTIQAQILELLDAQRRSSGLSILLITHDLGIVAERADHTAVMYAGQIVESAPTDSLLAAPRHPYTQALLASLPQYAEPGKPLPTMHDQLNSRTVTAGGCCFAGRCPLAVDTCRAEFQQLREIAPAHLLRCWKCS